MLGGSHTSHVHAHRLHADKSTGYSGKTLSVSFFNIRYNFLPTRFILGNDSFLIFFVTHYHLSRRHGTVHHNQVNE